MIYMHCHRQLLHNQVYCELMLCIMLIEYSDQHPKFAVK